MPAGQEQVTDAPDAARLVGRAADGDQQAWERLVDHYATLISAILEDAELRQSDAADLAQVPGRDRFERIHRQEHPGRDALSCLPPRGQHLLHLLMANPPACSAEIPS